MARLLVRVAIAPFFVIFLVRISLRVTCDTGPKGSVRILIRPHYIRLSVKQLPSFWKLVLDYMKVADISLVSVRLIGVFDSFSANDI
jgi:hypothetical protein